MLMKREQDLVTAPNCVVRLVRTDVSKEALAAAFEDLRSNLPWKQLHDDFGKHERQSYYCGDATCTFSFCGLTLRPEPWPSTVLDLRKHVAAACNLQPSNLTACYLNRYVAGDGRIVWHPDTVRAHGLRKIVATFSLGSSRMFRVRRRDGSGKTVEVLLHAGDVVLMTDDTQDVFEHELPLREGDAERISLTFRSIVPGFEDALAANGRVV